MISKLEKGEDPPTGEQQFTALQVISRAIHANYRSPFTLVVVLPHTKTDGLLLSRELIAEGALPMVVSCGVSQIIHEGKPTIAIVEPPSVHAIRGRKVVVFDSQGNWPVVYNVCRHLQTKKPQSMEVGSLFSQGPTPTWVNSNYVAFEVALDEVPV
jgi:hypothetical protein